jgi:hypothetical protein
VLDRTTTVASKASPPQIPVQSPTGLHTIVRENNEVAVTVVEGRALESAQNEFLLMPVSIRDPQTPVCEVSARKPTSKSSNK